MLAAGSRRTPRFGRSAPARCPARRHRSAGGAGVGAGAAAFAPGFRGVAAAASPEDGAAGSPDSGAWRRCRRGTLKLRCPGASAARIAAIAGGAPSPIRDRVAVARQQSEHGRPAPTPAVAIAQPQHRPVRSGAFRRSLAPSLGRRFGAAVLDAFPPPRPDRLPPLRHVPARRDRPAASPDTVSPGAPASAAAAACAGRRRRRRRRRGRGAPSPASAAVSPVLRLLRPSASGGASASSAGCLARSSPARFRVSLPFAAVRLALVGGKAGGGFGRIHVRSLDTLCRAACRCPAGCHAPSGRRRRDQPNSIARQKSREARAQRSGTSRFTPCP